VFETNRHKNQNGSILVLDATKLAIMLQNETKQEALFTMSQ